MSDTIYHTIARLRMQHQTAQEDLKLLKARAEQDIIENLNGSYGKNEEERKRQLTIGLAEHRGYQSALTMARQIENKLLMAEADVEVYRDARRMHEWNIRQQLADAIARRAPSADEHSTDTGIDDLADSYADEAIHDHVTDQLAHYRSMRQAHAERIDANRALADLDACYPL